MQLNPAVAVAPSVTAGNILGAARFAPGPVGANLGVTKRSWNSGDFVNGAFPASLDGVSVVPGAGGVYQFAVVVPASAPNGDLPVVAQLGTASSVATLITVQK